MPQSTPRDATPPSVLLLLWSPRPVSSSSLPWFLRLLRLFPPISLGFASAVPSPLFPSLLLVLQVSQTHSPSPEGSPVDEDGDSEDAEQGDAAHQCQCLEDGKVGCGREFGLQQETFWLDSRRKNLLTVNQRTRMRDKGQTRAGGGSLSGRFSVRNRRTHLTPHGGWRPGWQGAGTLVAVWMFVVKAAFGDVRRRVPQGPVQCPP